MTTTVLENPTPQQRRGVVVHTVLRAVLTTVLLVAVYFMLPLDKALTTSTILLLIGCLIALVVIVAWRIRQIVESDRPALRAIEILSAAFPLYILVFAVAYYLAERASPGSFSQTMDRTGALYFSMTVISTVGFGDIVAKTDIARIVVTTQMFLNLIVLGLGAKVILGAVNLGRQRHADLQGDPVAQGTPDPAGQSPI